MLSGKAMIIHLIVGLIKQILLYKMRFFPPFSHSKNKKEILLDLSNSAT